MGRITLQIIVDAERICLHVVDSGSGIEARLLPNVFELFTQGARTLDRTQGGLGIGLALVKAIVTLHGGTVRAHSEGLGRGSRFTVELPKVQCAPVTAAPNELVAGGDALRVLIVDDNVDAAESLSVLLTTIGYEVAIEFSAGAALRHVALRPAQAFVLDIGLPDTSGYELAERLRTMAGCEGAIFIALTGYGQNQDRARARDAGFHHHLVKPADIQHLIVALSGSSLGAVFATSSRLK